VSEGIGNRSVGLSRRKQSGENGKNEKRAGATLWWAVDYDWTLVLRRDVKKLGGAILQPDWLLPRGIAQAKKKANPVRQRTIPRR